MMFMEVPRPLSRIVCNNLMVKSERFRPFARKSTMLLHSGREEIQHRTLVDLVSDGGHMVAVRNRHRSTICESGCKRIGRTGENVLFAAHHQHRTFGVAKLLPGEHIAAAAHAGREREAILSRLFG